MKSVRLNMISDRIIYSLILFFLFIIGIFIHNRYIQPLSSSYKAKVDSQFIYPNIAVLVEFRSTPLLVAVVLNILHTIPIEWPIQIFHGKNNSNFLQNSQLSTYIQTKRILLYQLDEMVGDRLTYTNNLLTNITFWSSVKGEKVLFFQLDSIFCSNSPHKLNDFLKYDYIGAPWHSRFNLPARVGNGGFSLRSRSKILKLLKIRPYDRSLYEDVWFSKYLPLVNASIPPIDIAMKFSVETLFYATPMAVHKPVQLSSEELKILCEFCPELRMISSFCPR